MEVRQQDEVNFSIEEEIPCLKRLAAMRIVIEMWKHLDVMSAIQDRSWGLRAGFEGVLTADHFESLTILISEKLKSILPNVINDIAEDFITPIGLNICEWVNFIVPDISSLYVSIAVNSISWTAHGNVDYKKSVELYLNSINYELSGHDIHYALFPAACTFCVTQHIERLWNLMPVSLQTNIRNAVFTIPRNLLMIYWIQFHILGMERDFIELLRIFPNVFLPENIFSTDEFRVENVDKIMLIYAINCRYYFAVKYFYSKLTISFEDEKLSCCLELLLQDVESSYVVTSEKIDIIMYLFPKLTRQRQESIFQAHFYIFLMLMILRWPYQKFLPHFIEQQQNNLEPDCFYYIYHYILTKIFEGRFVEESLAEQIWYVIPELLKREFFRLICSDLFYLWLFENNPHESLLHVMKDSYTRERNGIFSYYEI